MSSCAGFSRLLHSGFTFHPCSFYKYLTMGIEFVHLYWVSDDERTYVQI